MSSRKTFKRITTIYVVLLLSSSILTASETFHYDAQGRLVKVSYGDTLSISYTYDANSNILSIVTAREAITAVHEPNPEDLIVDFALKQNYPNPFTHQTTIHFELPVETKVILDVYNNSGQLVCRLIDGTHTPGTYSVLWNGTDLNGQKSPPGVYFYRIETPAFESTARMILMR